MTLEEKMKCLADKIEDEVAGAERYLHVHIATENPIYLEMAKQELGHAEQLQKEAKDISIQVGVDSPYLYWEETKCLEKAYHKIHKVKEKIEKATL